MTGVRATTATCQATAAGGMVQSGIANGDLSTVSSGVMRVEYNRSGVKGIRTESATTSFVLRTDEPANAAWTKEGTGGIDLPSIDGGVDTSPNGGSAYRVQFQATTGVGLSDFYQAWTAASSGDPVTCSSMVRGRTVSGTTDICLYDGVAWTCSACAFVSDSWSVCSKTDTSTTGTTRYCKLGNNSNQNGGTARSQFDTAVWCMQGTSTVMNTSCVNTTSATVTRNADVVSFPITLSGTQFSAAISYDAPSVLVSGATPFQVYVDANNSVTAALDSSSHVTCTFRIGGSNSTVTSTATLTASAVNRVACTYGASGRSACVGGACTTTAGALTMSTGAATFYVGTRSTTGNESNGVMSQGCYDPLSARCI